MASLQSREEDPWAGWHKTIPVLSVTQLFGQRIVELKDEITGYGSNQTAELAADDARSWIAYNARKLGANAVLGTSYQLIQIAPTWYDCHTFGTAVVTERV